MSLIILPSNSVDFGDKTSLPPLNITKLVTTPVAKRGQSPVENNNPAPIWAVAAKLKEF